MKVLHVIPSIGPVRGGPSEAVLAMARSLRQFGVDVAVTATNDNGAANLSLPTGQWFEYEGVTTWLHPRWSPPIAALREFQYAPAFSDWLRRALDEQDCLHVHAVFSYLSTRAMSLARLAAKPYVARPLGQLDPWSLQQGAFKKKLYYGLAERRNLELAAAIHCTSDSEAANVKNLLPGVRLEVIPHGVTSRRLQPDAARRLRKKHAVPDNHPVLLFLSRWHAKKNIPLLLDSLAGLRQEPWTLILAGGTDDANFATAINERIQALGLHDRVHCPGHVSGDDKDLLLQGADLFVLPSASENFGIAVAEALVSGLPVLVSSGVDLAGAVRDLQGGMICEATLSSLQTGLRAMLQNCSRQSEEHRAALRAAATARFSWEQNALALRVLYEDICRPGHGHPQA